MDRQRRAREQRGRGEERRRRRDVARHERPRASWRTAGWFDVTDAGPRASRAGRGEHPLGVVARRARLDAPSSGRRAEAGEQDRGLHLGARDRQRVLDSRERGRPRRRAAGCRRSCDRGAHLRERLDDAVHRAPRERFVADERRSSRLEGEDPGEQPGERARVAAVDRPLGRRSRGGRRRGRRACRRPPRRPATPSARTASSVEVVSPERPQCETRVSPSEIAPSRSARCEIDLSPGTPMWPSRRAAGSTFIRSHRRRDDDAVALALEQAAARCASSSPLTSSAACRPARARRGRARSPGCRSGGAEGLEDLREHVGRSATWT